MRRDGEVCLFGTAMEVTAEKARYVVLKPGLYMKARGKASGFAAGTLPLPARAPRGPYRALRDGAGPVRAAARCAWSDWAGPPQATPPHRRKGFGPDLPNARRAPASAPNSPLGPHSAMLR